MLYTAVIIEPRCHKALELVLGNFNRNLNEDWKFLIYHGNNNREFIEDIIEKIGMKNRTTLIDLHVDNLTILEYSRLLYNKEFYEKIDTEMFLIFQVDTLICDEYKDNIYKFMQYDYVGAPWIFFDGVGNGGLSLRRKIKMLEIIDYMHSINYDTSNLELEDRVFSNTQDNIIFNIELNKPCSEEAKEFSVESIYSNNSFGLHKPWWHLTRYNLFELVKRFPELGKLIDLNN